MEPNKPIEICCQLTAPELQRRKATVMENLRKKITEIKELPNGFAFAFKGDDAIIDELVEFIKSERQCCPFFSFNLDISNKNNSTWLSITGPAGAKEFISAETGLTVV